MSKETPFIPDIEAIEKRIAEASPEPWIPVIHRDRSWRVFAPKQSLHLAAFGKKRNPRAEADANFTAHAREDMPALVLLVKEQAAHIRVLEEEEKK